MFAYTHKSKIENAIHSTCVCCVCCLSTRPVYCESRAIIVGVGGSNFLDRHSARCEVEAVEVDLRFCELTLRRFEREVCGADSLVALG